MFVLTTGFQADLFSVHLLAFFGSRMTGRRSNVYSLFVLGKQTRQCRHENGEAWRKSQEIGLTGLHVP